MSTLIQTYRNNLTSLMSELSQIHCMLSSVTATATHRRLIFVLVPLHGALQLASYLPSSKARAKHLDDQYAKTQRFNQRSRQVYISIQGWLQLRNHCTTGYNGASAIELLPVPIGAHCRHLPAAGS